jgi:hypothetical protein
MYNELYELHLFININSQIIETIFFNKTLYMYMYRY